MKRLSYGFLVALLVVVSFQNASLAANTDIIIKEITGLVQVQKAGAPHWAKAEESSTLTSGDKIRSFLESSALLAFPDGSEFRIRENTSLDIKDISQNAMNKTAKRELKLNLGSLHYKVPPKKEKATEFKIHSSTSIVGITGTEGIITAKGEGKLSENILIEGATYNTNDQGTEGRYQTSGNIFIHDGAYAQLFGAKVKSEAENRMRISEEYITLVEGAVALCKERKDQGYRVFDAQELIKQAFFYLEQRKYDLVKQSVDQAGDTLASAQKIKSPEYVDEDIAKASIAIKENETFGYDVSKVYGLLAKAQDLKQSGQFNDVGQILVQIEKELALLAEASSFDQKGSFLEHYQSVQERVLEKEQQGFVLNEVKPILRQGKISYEQDDRSRAYQLLSEAQDKIALAIKNVSDVFQEKIVRLQGEIVVKKAASYPTKELELRVEKIKVLMKEENFLKAQELVVALEDGLATLTKDISAEWKRKINDFKSDVSYKISTGYDLSEISGVIGVLEDYQSKGDLVNLEITFIEAKEVLEGIKLPAGFEASWNNFLKQRDIKKKLGYTFKEVDDLAGKIESAVNVGDIKSARSFLAQAKKMLMTLKDEEPPKVQVLSYVKTDELITIEGFARDNTKIGNVSVNGSVVKLLAEGKFLFKTVPTLSLKKISILAEDIEGNVSAPVVLIVEGLGQAIDAAADVKDVRIEYLANIFVVKGKFVPGGIVKVGAIETVCDDKGNFAARVYPTHNEMNDSIAVAGIRSEGVATDEVLLPIEDKWRPQVKIKKVYFDNNFAPALNVDPLNYKGNTISISGQVGIKQMANIEGHVSDLGGQIASLTIEGSNIDIRKDGAFNASLTIDPTRKKSTVNVIATDKAGNVAETKVALDVMWNVPIVKINTHKTFLNSFGSFSKVIALTKEVNDVVVALEDGKGKTVASKRLPVAAVLPPELEIQDIRYKGGKIHVLGRATTDATVSDKNKVLFPKDLQVLKNEVFTLSAQYPPVDREVILVASNIEGKVSQEVKVVAGPPKDTKAPVLYLSSPQIDKEGILITGFVEDESEGVTLNIQGDSVEMTLQGGFSHTIRSKELASVDVVATDVFGNKTREVIALRDQEDPEIIIGTWEAKDGKLIISGSATDNVGVKEVRLNGQPIARGYNKELSFSYSGTLTEKSQDVVIVAVDLMNNESREGPRTIVIPKDTSFPKGESIGIAYGSPIVYASGSVADPAGVKAVYVNGEEIELFDDGTFHIKVSIDVGLPKVMLESPAYDQGKVIIAGKIAPGDFSPAKITVESEDLSGNRGVLFTQNVMPYQLSEVAVAINGQVVEMSGEGNFSYEQPIILGERVVTLKVQDPFENVLFESVDLEDNKPVLNLEDLQYNADDASVILSGKAQDEQSGLHTVNVNGIRVDVSSDGAFAYKTDFTQGALNVIATDYIGNAASLVKEVSPPDIWPPVFSLNVSPVPAIVGNLVYVEIAVLDSNTRLPEVLKSAPIVTAEADGEPVSLKVEGEGANYIATLETTGLNASLVMIQVQGEDVAGNSSFEVEGMDMFALVADDAIAPSFTVEADPSSLALGETGKIKVYASEDLKESPVFEVSLPSGVRNTLELSSVNAGEYEAFLTVPVEEGIGVALLTLKGGEDLSGNSHEATETSVSVVAPIVVSELPLNINLIEFLANRFMINGQTASEAIVRIEVGKYSQDIVADGQGMFRFERMVSLSELDDMYSMGANIRVNLKAHNYAGFESRKHFFEVPLPPMPDLGGVNFEIRLHPSPAGQGDMVNISVDPVKPSSVAPRGFLYLPDGQRVLIDLQGGDVYTAQYLIPEDAALGAAMFEVVSDDIRESVGFDIGLSDAWMQRLNKYEFFKIRVSQDPLIIGEQAEFFVETMGDLPVPPRLEIMLPDGRRDNIPLSGNKRFFQGTYLSSEDLISGQAELILNPGTPEEVRRPYGVEDQFAEGDLMDVFLFANPSPLIGGEPYDVNISFSEIVPFIPRLALQLQNGRMIEMPLDGSASSNKFMASGTLPHDVQAGLAKFILFDDRNMMIDRFPAHVSAPFATTAGMDIFVVPDMLHHLDRGTIQLNSTTSLYERVEAHISYPDGTKMVLPLDGSDILMKATFVVPNHVPLGMVTIALFGENGNALGSVNAQVTEFGDEGSPLNIFLDKPDFRPFEFVKLNVESNWPLPFIPKAELLWDGGSLRISLNGQVPGNRFAGEFMAPRDPIDHGRIEIRDDRGTLLEDFPLDGGPEGEGDIIVTPMPPIIGQPLSITVIAPDIVDSEPMIRLIFEEGDAIKLNAYGPIPGDKFTASLTLLDRPLRMIEIVHEGRLVDSIPVEYLSTSSFEFFVDMVDEIEPCTLADIVVRSNSYVPFMPSLSVDFEGRIVNVALSKMSSTEFRGGISVPCDSGFDNYIMHIFDPQGNILWQRNFSRDVEVGGLLGLNVMSIDDDSVELSWDMLAGIEEYEIRYGQTTALDQTVYVDGVSDYIISDLSTGEIYFFEVAARKDYQDMMVSNIVEVVVGATTRELIVNHNMVDGGLQLYWADYAGADTYRIIWGTSPGSYDHVVNVNETARFIPDPEMGGYYYIKVKALQNNMVIGESDELFVHVEEFLSTGGEIEFNPEPPMQGQNLEIKMHFYEDLPYMPQVKARLQDRDVVLTPSGQLRDYTANLLSGEFNFPLLGVDVYDPSGNMIASRSATLGTYSSGAMAPINVMPDPIGIGVAFEVKVDFIDPPPFTPRLIIDFASRRKVYDFNQAPGMYEYTWNIPLADTGSSVTYMKVVNPNNGDMLGDRSFADSQNNSYDGAPFTVTPNSPAIGDAVNMDLDTDAVVEVAPKLKIYFVANSPLTVNMEGPLPGQHFEYSINSLGSLIASVDIIHPITNAVMYTWFPGAAVVVNVQTLTVSPNPPRLDQDMAVDVTFNVEPGFTPRWRIDTPNESFWGNLTKNSPTSYSANIFKNQFTAPPIEIEIQDDTGYYISGGEINFVYSNDFSCTPSISFSPSQTDANATLSVSATYDTGSMPTYNPYVFIEFDGGGQWYRAFTEGASAQNYATTVTSGDISGYLMSDVIKVGIGSWPGDGGDIDCGEDFAVSAVDLTAFTVIPDPPTPGADLSVTATFSGNVPFIPEAFIELDGTRKDYMFFGAAGQITYQLTIPADDITAPVDRVGVEDDYGALLDDIVFNNQGFSIQSISAIGSDQIEVCWAYDDWMDEYWVYYGITSGSYDAPVTGITSGCYTLGISEVLATNTTYYVKVEAYDGGSWYATSQEESIALTTTSVEYPNNLWTETTDVGGEIKIYWDNVSDVDGYRVYYGTSTKNYNESGSPLEVIDPNATQAVVTGLLDNTLYFLTVEAYIGAMESNNPNEVSQYPGTGGGGGVLSASEDVLNVSGNAGSPISQQSVTISNNGVAAVNVHVQPSSLIYGGNMIPPDRYTIAPLSSSIGASGGSQVFTINLDVPPAKPDGLYAGMIKFFADLDSDGIYDDGEAFVDVNVQLTISSFAYLEIEADKDSSTMGSPIFVTITAEDSNSNVVRSYNTDVNISVSESDDGQLSNSWILSTNGAPGGSNTSTVTMYEGIGNFTVDAQEPEILTITASGASGHGSPLYLDFLPNASASVATNWAIIAPNRVPVDDAVPLWIAAVDGSGKVVTDYTGTVTLGASGNGSNTPVLSNTSPEFFLEDQGQIQVTLTDTNPEDVTVAATGGGLTTDTTPPISFVGVAKYLVYGSSTAGTSFSTDDTTIRLTLRASDGSDNIIRSYNKTATFSTGDVDASLTGGSTVEFVDGIAEIVLNNNQNPETVIFIVDENDNPVIDTTSITVDFVASGPPPEIVRVEMDTPWIVHIYFSEDVASASGGEEGNYNVAGGWGNTVNKVCWYGDEVTLHLSNPPAALGGTFNLSVKNVLDNDGLHVGYPSTIGTPIDYNNIPVPNVDYQGSPGDGGDWFEIQVSDTSPETGSIVHVTVYHKNVCGYLSGDNATNANHTVGSINIDYENGSSLGIGGLVSPPTSVSVSDGKAEFDVTVASCLTAGTTKIRAYDSNVDTSEIVTLNIPAGCN